MRALIVFSLALGQMSAQVTGGTIQGTTTDPSSAAIANVQISILNIETGVDRIATSNSQGFYSAPNLPPGSYRIKASATGFSEATENVTLTVGGRVTADLAMKVGTASEQIEVTAAPAGVDLASSTLSATVTGKEIVELPLNARDWSALATLEPGVSGVRTQPGLAITNTRENRGLGASLTIGGNRPQQNNYRLDGISINDYANSAPGSVLGVVLGVDSVQEFSVITSNATADYGRSSGGVINSITRSGANTFHGAGYEFFRNSALDARNFFDGSAIPSFKRNQFGASAGGPIVKGRTFIFANYEGLRQGLGQTLVNTVLSPRARQGHLVSGDMVISPSVQPYLGLYPLPNGAITGDSGLFSFVGSQVTNQDYLTTKIDHTFSAKDSLAGTYLYDNGQTTGPDNFDNTILGAKTVRQVATLAETHIFGPSLLNTFRVGFSRAVAEAPQGLKALNPLSADTSLGFYPAQVVGQITVTGLANFQGGVGSIGEFDYHYNSGQLYDDGFVTKGAHAMKFGVAFETIQSNELGAGAQQGNYTFGSIAAFLTNKPTSFKGPVGNSSTVRSIRQRIFGTYFEDDWRVRPNLTVNIGLRYEMSTVPTEAHDRLTNLVNLTSVQTQLGSPYFKNPTLLNLEPRVGFSWDPWGTGKTAVRGSFGMFDVLPLPYLFELNTLQSAPFYAQGSASKLPVGSFPTGAVSLLSANNLRYGYIEHNPHRDYVMQWNFNIQREIVKDLTLLVGYVGSRGVHQPFHVEDMNFVLPQRTAAGYIWPTPVGSGTLLDPLAGQITAVLWQGNSFYHGLNAKLVRRMSHGLQVQASYTWAKSIDTSSASITGDTFMNSIIDLPYFDTRLTRALSDFDVRHNLVVSYTWELPSPPKSLALVHAIAGGWQWGGIFQASSGLPLSVGIGGDALGLNSAVTFDFPDRLTTPGCSSAVNPGSIYYIKISCFAFPNPAMRLGNAGRNILPGPNLYNVDTSLVRNIRLTERVSAQFRSEFFNVLNHTNFSDPIRANVAIFNQTGAVVPTGGLITTTATTSRQIQFGLKVIW
jgi:outer membrane receptor protein involved in Fe transport